TVGVGPVTMVGGQPQAQGLFTNRERILSQSGFGAGGGGESGSGTGMSTDSEASAPDEVTPGSGGGPGIRLVGSTTRLEQVSRSVDTPTGQLTAVTGGPVADAQRHID